MKNLPRAPLGLGQFLLLGMVLTSGCGEGGANPVRPVNGFIEVTLSAFEFRPDRIAMEVGQQVSLKVANTDTTRHTFTVKSLSIDVEILPGKSATIDLTGTREGTYTFYCAVPGHREKGMGGTLFVTQRPLPPPPSSGGGGYSY